MRIVLASDHAGFSLKQEVIPVVQQAGHTVIDVGTFDTAPVDYPDYAVKAAEVILAGDADRGILICGSGVGITVAANKIPGIRACCIMDHYSAHQGVEHDNMNVLVLGGRTTGPSVAADLVRAFLAAQYTGEARHARRLQKVLDIESHAEQFRGVARSKTRTS
ncbi:MAG: ribose 5-phosphate isomerase B [Phycisphaerae bacterium]|nr:ribose 5-phosphate isomerase B [Phycisphaerae bacterium]